MKVYVVVTDARYDRNLGVFATRDLAMAHQRAKAEGWDDWDNHTNEWLAEAYAWHNSVVEEYEVVAQPMEPEERKILSDLSSALTIAQMAIEQRSPLTARVAANGPTVGEVIGRALAAADTAR